MLVRLDVDVSRVLILGPSMLLSLPFKLDLDSDMLERMGIEKYSNCLFGQYNVFPGRAR